MTTKGGLNDLKGKFTFGEDEDINEISMIRDPHVQDSTHYNEENSFMQDMQLFNKLQEVEHRQREMFGNENLFEEEED